MAAATARLREAGYTDATLWVLDTNDRARVGAGHRLVGASSEGSPTWTLADCLPYQISGSACYGPKSLALYTPLDTTISSSDASAEPQTIKFARAQV